MVMIMVMMMMVMMMLVMVIMIMMMMVMVMVMIMMIIIIIMMMDEQIEEDSMATGIIPPHTSSVQAPKLSHLTLMANMTYPTPSRSWLSHACHNSGLG